MADKSLTPAELYDAGPMLSLAERVEGFEFLQRDDADDFFRQLSARDRAELILALPAGERRLWMRLLPPDDAADVIQETPAEARENLRSLLDDFTQREVKGLLDYAEDEAGGLMNTRYSRLRVDMTVDEAISYLRRDARAREKTVYYVYVIDAEERLLGVVSFRDLIVAPGDKRVGDVMRTEVIWARDDLDQEALSKLFMRHHLLMMPIVDSAGRIKGVVSVNDIVDVVQEEATEDILVASTVALSLIGVVLWGAVAGSILPFVLRVFGLDPASASAPFVATLVDVTGLIIYFTIAAAVLRGTLL
jgi:magnesium transporter